jgi:hypothetical protein
LGGVVPSTLLQALLWPVSLRLAEPGIVTVRRNGNAEVLKKPHPVNLQRHGHFATGIASITTPLQGTITDFIECGV